MIEEIMKFLTPEKRHQLMIAFNDEFTDTIDLPDGKFIGVNILENPDIEIIERKGSFVFGKVKKGN